MWNTYVQIYYCINLFNMVDSKHLYIQGCKIPFLLKKKKKKRLKSKLNIQSVFII